MKVITLSEVASRIRCRRSGKTFLTQFINECTIENAIPLDRIKQARAEIQDNYEGGSHADDFADGYDNAINDCVEILDKLIESEGK